jgi:hypothetical protein
MTGPELLDQVGPDLLRAWDAARAMGLTPDKMMGIAIDATGIWHDLALKYAPDYDQRRNEGPIVYAVTDRASLGGWIAEVDPSLGNWFRKKLPPGAFLCALFADVIYMTQLGVIPLSRGSEALS